LRALVLAPGPVRGAATAALQRRLRTGSEPARLRLAQYPDCRGVHGPRAGTRRRRRARGPLPFHRPRGRNGQPAPAAAAGAGALPPVAARARRVPAQREGLVLDHPLRSRSRGRQPRAAAGQFRMGGTGGRIQHSRGLRGAVAGAPQPRGRGLAAYQRRPVDRRHGHHGAAGTIGRVTPPHVKEFHMKTLGKVALATALAGLMAPAIAQETIGTMQVNGSVSTSMGGDFIPAASGEAIQAGERIMVGEGSSASISFTNGAVVEYTTPGVYTVQMPATVATTVAGNTALTPAEMTFIGFAGLVAAS